MAGLSFRRILAVALYTTLPLKEEEEEEDRWRQRSQQQQQKTHTCLDSFHVR